MSRCWAWGRGERAALFRLDRSHSCPEHRTQEATQVPHPHPTPPRLWGPSRSLDFRAGSRESVALCPHVGPAWSRATPAPVLGRWRVPPTVSSLLHPTHDPWTWGMGQGSASSLPAPSTHRCCRERVWAPCRFPPQATWLTAAKAMSICLAKSGFTRFCSFVLGNG